MPARKIKAKPQHTYQLTPLAALTMYEQNPRTHSDAQIEQIRASIKAFGFTNPVLIDETNQLIAGHGRYLAAKLEGMIELPSIVIRGLTDAQRRALVIADNQLALNASWNDELLRAEIEALMSAGFDVPLLGFSEAQLAELMSQATEGLTDPDAAPEPPSVPVSASGDLWLLGQHRLICGDATLKPAVDQLLAGAKPHLMVTDPPYGVEYDPEWRAAAGVNKNKKKMGKVQNDSRVDWREAWRLFTGDVVYCWHADRHASIVQTSLEATGFQIRCQIIWHKDRFALSRGHYHWQHEPCWYAVREDTTAHWHGNHSQSTVWEIPAREDSGLGHSTQKPIDCMRRPIDNNSLAGDAVYDPFVGSGTTIIACQMTARRALAIELNPAYVDVCVERWQNFTGQSARLEANGLTFEQVRNERHERATPTHR